MIDLYITIDMASKGVSSSKSSVSSTLYQISVLFLIKNSSSLSLLFDITLRRRRVLQIWKKAIITPTHKKGSRNTALNHKPVQLTAIIYRTEEHIIHNYMICHLLEYHLISDVQNGFVKRKLISYFLMILSHIIKVKLSGKMTYLDFAKAFN